MLGLFKKKLADSVKKLSGNTDFLEAVCAGAALVACADGDISDTEVETTIKTVSSNPTLNAAFSQSQIGATIDTMLKRAQAGRTGRVGLYKEIDDIASNDDMKEIVYLCALDVAEAEGGIDPTEQAVLNKIASKLSLDPKKYDV